MDSMRLVHHVVRVIRAEMARQPNTVAPPEVTEARHALARALDAWRAGEAWPAPHRSPLQRAAEDPVFASLVNLLYGVMLRGEGQYTASEVREAAMVAMTKYEMLACRRLWLAPDEPLLPVRPPAAAEP